ncbi:MAG: ATPase domain-containing protein [Promethearchaeota archaeon]
MESFAQKEEQKKQDEEFSEYFRTTNDELDRNLGGGVKVGSLGIIVGDMGAGKSVWSQQICYGALRCRKTVTFITSEMTVKGLVQNMMSLSWKRAEHYFLTGQLDIVPVVSQNGKVLRTPDVLYKLIDLLTNCESDVIFIDSLTYFVGKNFKPKEIIFFFELCKRLTIGGKTIFVSIPTYFPELYDFIELNIMNICDLILRFEQREEDGQAFKACLVLKWLALDEINQMIVFTVDSAFGIAVSVVSAA